MNTRRRPTTLICVGVLIGFTACSAPIGVKRVGMRPVYRSLRANALSTDRPSEWTRNTVNSWGLLRRFDDDPEGALGALREIVTSGRGASTELFALGELSFLHAEDTGKKPYYFAATVYMYAFLFPGERHDRPDELDPRTRLAVDFYNHAIARAFESRDGRTVDLAPGTYPLPFGEREVWMNPGCLYWADRRLVDFVPMAELAVRGMRNRYRSPGVGAPLAARAVPREDVDVERSLVGRRVRVPATALLRLYDVHDGIVSGRLRSTLEVYTASDAETVAVEGRTVPLEFEETATIASQLAESPIWKRELWGFLGRAETGDRLPARASSRPCPRGRIPVVFVHGTASSPGRWADMVNDLLADPWIRHRCHFWFFMYDTGNPVAYSAMLLRDKLTDTVSRLDPDNLDPCLRQMVVVGHSQGGLLTKLTVVDTGPRLWNSVSRVPLAGVPASDEFRTLLSRALFALDPIRAGDDPGDATHPARPRRRAGGRGSALRASGAMRPVRANLDLGRRARRRIRGERRVGRRRQPATTRAIESREVGQRAHIEHSADQDPGFLRPRIHRYPWAGKYGDDGRDHAAPRLPPAPSSPAFAADDSDRHHAAGRLDGVRRPPLARHRGARRRPQDHLGRRADPRLPDGERAHDGSGQMAGRSGRSDRIRARRVAGRHPRPESHFLRGRYRPEGCECSVPAALRDLSAREGVVRQIAAADGVRLANREAGVAPRFRLGTRVQDWSAARELLRRAVLERLDERVDAAIWGELWRLAAVYRLLARALR